MSVRLLTFRLAMAGLWRAAAQDAGATASPSAACIEFNLQIVEKIDNGQLADAEAALSGTLARTKVASEHACYLITLHNMARAVALLGRFSEAEVLAERGIRILDKLYPTDSPLRFGTLQLLWSVQSQQGKLGKARQTFLAMRSLRLDKAEDRSMFHFAAAAQLQVDGKYKEAETEYVKSISAWEESGRGESAQMAVLISGLASLQLAQARDSDAAKTLERALAILTSARDVLPLDRISILLVRAILGAYQDNWNAAEADLRSALSVAEREAQLDPAARKLLLVNFAYVLRKLRRTKEARTIEARAASINAPGSANAIVDVSEFLKKARIRKSK